MQRNHRQTRGNVAIEYVLLVGLLLGGSSFAAVFPQALGNLLIDAGDNMEAPASVADAPGPADGDDGVAEGPTDPADDPPPSDWGDDPWGAPPDGNDTSNSGCNQGLGNGGEDCDPGNSNQGDPSMSNDEVDDWTPRGRR